MKIGSFLRAFLTAAVLAAPVSAAQDIAVLPYSVETISSEFPPDSGGQYAKLIGVAAAIDKGIAVYPVREAEKDITRQGLDVQGKITKEDLSLFCKSRYLSYAVAGRISRTSQGFASSSILYSVKGDAVVASAKVSARTLPELAAKESRELFLSFDDRNEVEKKESADIVLVLDTSYLMAKEWKDITRGIENLSADLFDAWPGSAIHIVPFGEGFTLNGMPDPCETVPAVKSRLASYKLKGGSTGASMLKALEFSVGNAPWRKDASRSILIISNAPLKGSSLETAALRAKRKRISLSALVLGGPGFDDVQFYSRAVQAGGGSFVNAAYRQKIYDNRGSEYFLLMERGRLFESDDTGSAWKDGLFRSSGSGSSYIQGPSFADEIAVKKNSFAVTPYSMSGYYAKNGTRSVLNSAPLETNCGELLGSIADRLVSHDRAARGRSSARVLLSQGNVSLWVSVTDEKDLAFFSDRKELGFVFPLGVRLSVRRDEPLGFTFNPDTFYTGFQWDDLPDSIRVNLSDMAKDPSRYAGKGLFSPPVWFVNVKVEEVDVKKTGGDIRD
ncbi:MAG: vWA domain-containing protein [Spirochaetota bacterium]